MNKLPYQVEREIIVKRDFQTNPELGQDPNERSAEELIQFGVINLNKPKGPTSHLTAEYVKKILNVKKAGHGGSLDPAVTGVLPVALDRATRIMDTFLKAGKEYVGILRLHKEVDESKIRAAIKEFTGKITQIPPVKSAVVRKERERNVYYFNILEIDGKSILFKIGCQAGTYIRKICHDLGLKLKCGAHMFELIRTKAGCFSDKDWVSLQDLEDAFYFYKEENNDKYLRFCIKPIEYATSHLPKIWVQDSAVPTICHGADLKIPGITKFESKINKQDTVAIMSEKDELVAIGPAMMTSDEIEKETKGLAVKTEKVFMKENLYKV